MKMITFSIVIPVYNVQDYLIRCVESVALQNYPKEMIQILLIDDGSKDLSGVMCDELARRYDNVEVFHKENGGLSDARNYGMKYAQNEYIVFLDSDDYLAPDTCARFADAIGAQTILPDVVSGTTIKMVNDERILIRRHTANMEMMRGDDFLLKELQSNSFFVTAWSSIYKRSFLMNNQLCFLKGVLHEDEDFTPRVLLKADSVLSTDIPFYYYVIRENSIITKKDRTSNAISIFEICEGLTKLFDEIENVELKNLLKTHLAKIMLFAIERAELYKKDRRYIIKRELIKQNCIFKKEKLRYLLLRISPKLLHVFVRMWRH